MDTQTSVSVGAYSAANFADGAEAACSLVGDFIGPWLLAVQDNKVGNSNLLLRMPPYTPQLSQTWNDKGIAAERGAILFSVLECQRTRNLEVVGQLRKGGGFDYCLNVTGSAKNAAPGWEQSTPIRLEVSGISSTSSTTSRVNSKFARPTAANSTAYVCIVSVVNFAKAEMRIEER